jgi:hypothetical protein
MLNNQEFVEKIIEKCDTETICKHLNSMIGNLTSCGSIKNLQIYWLYKLGKISRDKAVNSKSESSMFGGSHVKDLIEQIEYLESLEMKLQGHHSVHNMSSGLFRERFVQRPVENDVMNKLIEELSPKVDENGNVLSGDVIIVSGSGRDTVKGGDVVIKASQGKEDGEFHIVAGGITYQWPKEPPSFRRPQNKNTLKAFKEDDKIVLKWR